LRHAGPAPNGIGAFRPPYPLIVWKRDEIMKLTSVSSQGVIVGLPVECERVFSSAKKLIAPARNHLQEDIIEATECLKAWWDEEIIQQ
jgi:hypothetical protein